MAKPKKSEVVDSVEQSPVTTTEATEQPAAVDPVAEVAKKEETVTKPARKKKLIIQ